MANFLFSAIDSDGQEQSGTLEAPSEGEAINILKANGFNPTSVSSEEVPKAASTPSKARKKRVSKPRRVVKSKTRKKGGKSFLSMEIGGGKSRKKKKSVGRVKGKSLMLFTRQLATLIDSGLPLLRGLNVLGKQEPNKNLRGTILTLADSVQSGSTFSESLSAHPKIFNKLFINMVRAGELGGVLELVLNRLAEYQEKAQKLKNKIVSAMVYPIVVLVIAIVIIIFLMTFIVPKFKQIFDQMLNGASLPGITQFVINMSNFIKGNIWWILIGFAVLYFSWIGVQMTKPGRRFIDKMKLIMPLIGKVQSRSAIARFTRTLGTLVTSGVPILQALSITKETAGNVIISEAISKVHDAVKEGESVVAPMEASKVFPPMVLSMVDVGEETGQLPEMLLKIADVYDDEVDNSVSAMTSLLEPMMIIFLAVVVGVIVLALFMPLIKVIQTLNQGF